MAEAADTPSDYSSEAECQDLLSSFQTCLKGIDHDRLFRSRGAPAFLWEHLQTLGWTSHNATSRQVADAEAVDVEIQALSKHVEHRTAALLKEETATFQPQCATAMGRIFDRLDARRMAAGEPLPRTVRQLRDCNQRLRDLSASKITYSLFWDVTRPCASEWASLLEYTRHCPRGLAVNRIPGLALLSNKARLATFLQAVAKALDAMASSHPASCRHAHGPCPRLRLFQELATYYRHHMTPATYVLPRDLGTLLRDLAPGLLSEMASTVDSRGMDLPAAPGPAGPLTLEHALISKPPRDCGGRGIFITRDLAQVLLAMPDMPAANDPSGLPCSASLAAIRRLGLTAPQPTCQPRLPRAPAPRSLVAQQYLHRPHLIAGYKYDLRVYVVAVRRPAGAAAGPPLDVWVYREGLIRVCPFPYPPARSGLSPGVEPEFDNLHAHLTNTCLNRDWFDAAVGNGSANGTDMGSSASSIGAGDSDFEREEDGAASVQDPDALHSVESCVRAVRESLQHDGAPPAWPLSTVWAYIDDEHRRTSGPPCTEGPSPSQRIRRDIYRLVSRTLVPLSEAPANRELYFPCETSAPASDRGLFCFELYGFDLMLHRAAGGQDAPLQPALLEVNQNPSLSPGLGDADHRIKAALIGSLAELVEARNRVPAPGAIFDWVTCRSGHDDPDTATTGPQFDFLPAEDFWTADGLPACGDIQDATGGLAGETIFQSMAAFWPNVKI
ncbi:hypothetical protein H696_00924 [Fonticula alba]|uniref:Tubulin-tyrosine ligase n=1 Tax=Fonticula alba TaxID=691883 RepID=A0A058ZG63_FONAL|nr:hypothetical protein H696_00924 [Fonticula alba]KCV73385.1 hypothetical protein H696_00924 [Fonticula alba]|eukprot:XP_009493086.1 hypothetical protein H696_00924 [Fonticula alba]